MRRLDGALTRATNAHAAARRAELEGVASPRMLARSAPAPERLAAHTLGEALDAPLARLVLSLIHI